MKIYVAGKVRKDSSFGTHYWRDDFIKKLQELSGREIESLDPTKAEVDQAKPSEVFGADAYLISQSDAVVVYLSDDISVGGSQEILIAKHYKKPVIGLAPRGGKFNGSKKELFGKVIEDYKDPFVFTTCDVVCATVEEVAEQLKQVHTMNPKTLQLVDDLANFYRGKLLKNKA
jgi:hypothetical protein